MDESLLKGSPNQLFAKCKSDPILWNNSGTRSLFAYFYYKRAIVERKYINLDTVKNSSLDFLKRGHAVYSMANGDSSHEEINRFLYVIGDTPIDYTEPEPTTAQPVPDDAEASTSTQHQNWTLGKYKFLL